MLGVGLEIVCFSRLPEEGNPVAKTFIDDITRCVVWCVLYRTLLSAYVGKCIEFALGFYTKIFRPDSNFVNICQIRKRSTRRPVQMLDDTSPNFFLWNYKLPNKACRSQSTHFISNILFTEAILFTKST